ncbi:hypothetical protein [Candidatus Thiothrix anitrata]|uniref:hypothetical protein n=1 Tax=Candidatus Thiothrix anitrata TaxID=2823902 RepID=UPI00224BA2A8|nr:hypothetical protein [Candidatus Thiothrix anitrata]
MSELNIYADNSPQVEQTHTDYATISALLAEQGVRFERWQASVALADDATQADVIAAYRIDIERLMAENGFQSVDVISLTPDHPDKAMLRQKFLNEHTAFGIRSALFCGRAGFVLPAFRRQGVHRIVRKG